MTGFYRSPGIAGVKGLFACSDEEVDLTCCRSSSLIPFICPYTKCSPSGLGHLPPEAPTGHEGDSHSSK